VANEPKSPITALAELLSQQPTLKRPGVTVHPWRKGQSKSSAANRIVLVPTKTAAVAAASKTEGLCDFEQHFRAKIWGADGEAAWAILTWLIQALESQSVSSDDQGSPGYFWWPLGADWEDDADGSKGEVVSLIFWVRFTVLAVPFDPGHLGQWPLGRIDAVTDTLEDPDTGESATSTTPPE